MIKKIEVNINKDSRIPKYKQVVDSIINDIVKGKIKVGQKIPSINELSESAYLSRDTVEKAYKQLKDRKIIISVKGKGYYTAKTDLLSKINIFFLVNKPSSYKMMIYNSFVNAIGINGHVTIYIYHCDESLFIKAIERNIGAFDYYVIMSHFRNENLSHISSTDKVLETIEKIPKDKLILIDNLKPEIKGEYASVFQDYKKDLFQALSKGLDKIKKYDKLILVYPSKSIHPYPHRISQGFRQFCIEHDIDFEILEEIYDDMEFGNKDAYITIEEMDLVNLVRQIREHHLKLGTDIGVISYNDTPLKDLLGITVISTDFKAMGETAAEMILKKKKERVKNPFNYIERNSI